MWVVTDGKGKAVVNGQEINVKTGDTINLPCGSKHTIIAETDLQMIEVQLGEDIRGEDKVKFEM
ncbi:MAG: cupin domain-containing protein [Candidatus Gastranaerophilaceae bacterium]